jgi:hypothetical protein
VNSPLVQGCFGTGEQKAAGKAESVSADPTTPHHLPPALLSGNAARRGFGRGEQCPAAGMQRDAVSAAASSSPVKAEQTSVRPLRRWLTRRRRGYFLRRRTGGPQRASARSGQDVQNRWTATQRTSGLALSRPARSAVGLRAVVGHRVGGGLFAGRSFSEVRRTVRQTEQRGCLRAPSGHGALTEP